MPGILINDIRIERSSVINGSYNLIIESGPFKYTGNFAANDLMHFMTCCSEAMRYFGAAYGLTRTDAEGNTRQVRK